METKNINVCETFPDGTPIDGWFYDTNVPSLEKIGKQYVLTAYGILDDGKKEVTLYGDINDNDVPYSSILSTKTESSNELPRHFYLLERRVENIDIELEEKDENDNVVKNTYSRPVTIFTIDGDLKEVKVIKVKNTYYLKQEQK